MSLHAGLVADMYPTLLVDDREEGCGTADSKRRIADVCTVTAFSHVGFRLSMTKVATVS